MSFCIMSTGPFQCHFYNFLKAISWCRAKNKLICKKHIWQLRKAEKKHIQSQWLEPVYSASLLLKMRKSSQNIWKISKKICLLLSSINTLMNALASFNVDQFASPQHLIRTKTDVSMHKTMQIWENHAHCLQATTA